jgi:hypothetical protein
MYRQAEVLAAGERYALFFHQPLVADEKSLSMILRGASVSLQILPIGQRFGVHGNIYTYEF